MLRFPLALALLLIPLAAAAATNVGPGDVDGSWTAAGSPYLVQGHLRVPAGQSLLIEPGVDVRFTGNYVLRVEGAILAAGGAGNEIHFRPDAAGITWGHIEITAAVDGASGFFFCIFEGGNALANQAPYNRYGGAVWVGAGAIVSLTGCVIDGCVAEQGGGLYSAGEVALTGCVIRYCQAPGGALQGHGGGLYLIGEAAVIDCEVSGNVTEFIGGGIYAESFNGTVTDSRILRNRSDSHGGGIGCEGLQASASLYGNLIAGNEVCSSGGCLGGGVYVWYADGSQILANTIVDNVGGGGAGLGYGYATLSIERCVIAFNHGVASVDFSDTSAATFAQTCVWGNTEGDQLQGDESETLLADPRFCDAAADDYTLCADSPCLPLFIGAFGQGCAACNTAAAATSWSRVKASY